MYYAKDAIIRNSVHELPPFNLNWTSLPYSCIYEKILFLTFYSIVFYDLCLSIVILDIRQDFQGNGWCDWQNISAISILIYYLSCVARKPVYGVSYLRSDTNGSVQPQNMERDLKFWI